jgi:hypothetical protein
MKNIIIVALFVLALWALEVIWLAWSYRRISK